MAKRFLFTTIFLMILPHLHFLSAQERDYDKWLELEQESEDQSDLLEYLEWRQDNPLDINRATQAELQRLPWITPSMAQAIVLRRQQSGGITALRELDGIGGLDAELMRILKPYLICQSSSKRTGYQAEIRQRLNVNQQVSSGFINKIYSGDRYKIYNRLRLNLRDRLRFGAMTEKDPGESDLHDLMRAYAVLNVAELNSEIVLGHFTVESGQGLVFSPLFQIGRTYDPVLSQGRRLTGLRPSVSAAEYGGYYGMAVRVVSGQSEFILFSSKKRWDATVENDTVRSIVLTGLHRTATESDKKNKLLVHTGGLIFSRTLLKSLRLALAWRGDHYSHFIARGEELKDHHDFTGKSNRVTGLQIDFFKGPFIFYGEWARNRAEAEAYRTGIRLQGKGKSLLLSWHHFSPAFDDPQAKGFNQAFNNETGLYGAFRSKIKENLILAAYYEYSRNPWPRYRLPMPNFGRHESMATMEWRTTRTVAILLRLKHRRDHVTENYQDGFGNEVKKITSRTNWHGTGQIDITRPPIYLRTRLAFNLRKQQVGSPQWPAVRDSSGLIIWQQVQIKSPSWLNVTARCTFFDSPSYDTRFYSYENDLRGVWRNKMLYGRGMRWFLFCSVRPFRPLTVGIKWDGTFYDDRDHYGSGWDRVNSKYENRISIQWDWRWSQR
ncbi:helix-hairpin-helix domain-containing protein [candidate division KSB1 bacterium]|nr:helix-hairpin-helix domain-containing protein [candidate division KSB1 bacterium]